MLWLSWDRMRTERREICREMDREMDRENERNGQDRKK